VVHVLFRGQSCAAASLRASVGRLHTQIDSLGENMQEITFESLGLRPELLQAVTSLGYEAPTPIQAQAIPTLLTGSDIIGQAQTGTGKTAAYALPLLNGIQPGGRLPQALVLTPTRELALQVSQATHEFAAQLKTRILPVYGGAPYARQIHRLSVGVDVVVGTPGRLIDLIERGSLNLSEVRMLVIDEADEMLKMGFIDDVERILRETPAGRQTALFSATMPAPIRNLAGKYLNEPVTVTIQASTLTVPQIEQRYYLVHESNKLAALARLLEVEDITSALIFAKTKIRTGEVAEALNSRGFHAEALNGDLSQDARETVLRRFRNGNVVFLVATDVVARGVDIPAVSHVINLDMPQDAEDYVHRIGRTGRAGRTGVAITLVTPRETRWLQTIQNFTRQQIAQGKLPGREEIIARRDTQFVEGLEQQLETETMDAELALVMRMVREGYEAEHIAAAAIRLARSGEESRPIEDIREIQDRGGRRDFRDSRDNRDNRGERGTSGPRPERREREAGMVRLIMDVGREHGLRPADVVGSIATEAGIPGKSIGAIDIQSNRTFVDVQEAHVERVLASMDRAYLRGRKITLTAAGANSAPAKHAPRRANRAS
jgi:ATP-dependent RNA helicase DeaD